MTNPKPPTGAGEQTRKAAADGDVGGQAGGGVANAPPAAIARIQRRRTKGWKLPDNAVCVDRSTPFGNPFPVSAGTSCLAGRTEKSWVVGTWTGPDMWLRETKEDAIELSVKAFRVWIGLPAQETLRDEARIALRGKSLCCWCALDQPCHADVLMEIANA